MSDKYSIRKPKLLEVPNAWQLELILDRLADDTGSEEDKLSLVQFVIHDFYLKNKREFTEDEVQERYTELIVGHILRRLSEKKMIDVSIDEHGEEFYTLSEKGKEIVNDK